MQIGWRFAISGVVAALAAGIIYLGVFVLKSYTATMLLFAGIFPWSLIAPNESAFWYNLGRYGGEALFGLTTWFVAVFLFVFACISIAHRWGKSGAHEQASL